MNTVDYETIEKIYAKALTEVLEGPTPELWERTANLTPTKLQHVMWLGTVRQRTSYADAIEYWADGKYMRAVQELRLAANAAGRVAYLEAKFDQTKRA